MVSALLEWGELWTEMKTRHYAGSKEPVPTTEDMYYEMLEVLPPQAYGRGGAFLTGEPWSQTPDGEFIYSAFLVRVEKGSTEKSYRAMYMTEAEFLAKYGN